MQSQIVTFTFQASLAFSRGCWTSSGAMTTTSGPNKQNGSVRFLSCLSFSLSVFPLFLSYYIGYSHGHELNGVIVGYIILLGPSFLTLQR